MTHPGLEYWLLGWALPENIVLMAHAVLRLNLKHMCRLGSGIAIQYLTNGVVHTEPKLGSNKLGTVCVCARMRCFHYFAVLLSTRGGK